MEDNMNDKVQKVIDRLEQEPKQGESYDQKGRHGWRNPIRADTGVILQILAATKKPRQALEIGTARGLSLCYLALGSPETVFTTIEWDEQTAQEARANFKEAGLKVRVLCGDAVKIIPTLDRSFELLFLDANKDGYLEQFRLLQTYNLLSPNCLVIADNVIDRQSECQNFLDFMQTYPNAVLKTDCGLFIATI